MRIEIPAQYAIVILGALEERRSAIAQACATYATLTGAEPPEPAREAMKTLSHLVHVFEEKILEQ